MRFFNSDKGWSGVLSLALLALSIPAEAARSSDKDKTLLSNVKTLTLRKDRMTSHRRVPAVPQLKCTGPGCKHYQVDTLRCTNAGYSFTPDDVEWTCTAELPPEFRLGFTDVQCEGYASRDDKYVLRGSCGVEYRLLLTELGEEKFGSGKGWNLGGGSDDDSGSSPWWFWLVFATVVLWILYSAYNGNGGEVRVQGGRRRPARRGGFGGGGWGAGDDDDDPPPPYDAYSSSSSRKPSSTSSRRTGRQPAMAERGWRPGFWTGAATGAAAGYAMGSRNSGGGQETGGGWFGGGSRGESSRSGARGGGGGGSSYSDSTYESTGFGSTSRR